jgi:general secretion pathway protein D
VSFSVFHIGDTPKKLRSQLNAAKRGKRAPVARPSGQFEPQLPDPRGPQSDGLPRSAVHDGELPTPSLDPSQEAPLSLPDSGGRLKELPAPQRVPGGPDDELDVATGVPQPTPKSQATQAETAKAPSANPHLLAARKALAVGDVRRATAALETARQIETNYGVHDDTPDKVDAAIRDYRNVMELLNAHQDSEAARHQLAMVLMDQAQQLMRWRDFDEAERLALSIKSLRVNYTPFELQPDAVLEKIAAARKGAPPAGAAAGPDGPTVGPEGSPAHAVTQALYDEQRDTTRTTPASADENAPPQPESEPSSEAALPDPSAPAERLPEPEDAAPRPIANGGPTALELFRAGEEALQQRDKPKALELLQQAYELRDQLNAQDAQRLQDHLQMLAAPAPPDSQQSPDSLIGKTTEQQQLLAKQLLSDIAQKQVAAGKIREKDPTKSMELLKEARASVESAGLDPQIRAQLLRRVDRSIQELDRYITDNRAQIELDAANKAVLREVERRQQAKIEVDEKLARLVDEFNKLMDEERYAEAEVLAKRARELDPDNALVQQLLWQSRFVIRNQRNQDLTNTKEDLTWKAYENNEEAGTPFDDREPYLMPDAKKWDELTKSRSRLLAEKRSRRTERELEIERKLKTPVMLKFRDAPLSEVLNHLATVASVNLHLDAKGLEEEGVSSDTPVTIELTHEIQLKSALNLILEPKHLSYVIKDEVLKITSEQLRDGEIYPVTYNVADLVIPIPNFVPNGRTGLTGAIGEAYNMAGGAWGGMGGVNGVGAGYLASHDGSQAMGIIDPKVLAQINQLMPSKTGASLAGGSSQSAPFGPGGMGGGAQADFDSLIELITTTVKPQTWDEVGGPGSISEFQNNLSLVISQTQDVHEEIVDLLEQLRKNQDLQVTIEVRFITLNDNVFEQIGVDFQANIVNTNADEDPTGPGVKDEIVGLQEPAAGAPFPNFTTNLEIPFRQNSFNLATPQFGTPVNVANFGFAILSDIEAYFLVNASQGDRRSNVLQAPKVTMFNGQAASVFDTTNQPFLISVIPVVGDFAAAYQPVITVLTEGSTLTVQAVVSADRRFVRLTVIPFFSQIGDVSEFMFSGSTTTTKNTSSEESTGGGSESSSASDDETTTTEGVTIQLPSFTFVSVSTTVSVPDGGTVLLGGIKRLSEGRNEFGVPILSKLPYINRLFKNVGIGRETSSLMMMVTPRIIIQEEEEERLGIQTAP